MPPTVSGHETDVDPATLVEFSNITTLLSQVQARKSTFEEGRSTLATVKTELVQAVERYNQARLNLFLERMRERGEGWCTFGRHIARADDIKPMLIVQSYWRGGHGYEHIEDCKDLHQACGACQQKALIRGNNSSRRDGDSFQVLWVGEGSIPEDVDAFSVREGEDITSELESTYGLPPRANWAYEVEIMSRQPDLLIVGNQKFDT